MRADASSIVVAVADDSDQSVEIEVYVGNDERPRLGGLLRVFEGAIHMSSEGLLVFAPTGDEVQLDEIHEGVHELSIWEDGYPTKRLVVLVDATSPKRSDQASPT